MVNDIFVELSEVESAPPPDGVPSMGEGIAGLVDVDEVGNLKVFVWDENYIARALVDSKEIYHFPMKRVISDLMNSMKAKIIECRWKKRAQIKNLVN